MDIGISTIILIRNSAKNLDRLLSSFFKVNTHRPLECIIIDHACPSTQPRDGAEGSYASLLTPYASLCFIRYIKTLSPYAFNLGAEKADYGYLLFLSTDVVYTSDALPPALAELEQDPTLGAVGIRLDDTCHREKERSKKKSLYLNADTLSGKQDPYSKELTTENAFPLFPFSFLLCRKKDFQSINGFSQSYPLRLQGVDFSLRLMQILKKNFYSLNGMNLKCNNRIPVTEEEINAVVRLNKEYPVELFKHSLDTQRRMHRPVTEGSTPSKTVTPHIPLSDEDALRLNKWRSLATLHAQHSFDPPDIHYRPPIGWIQPHLNMCGGIRRVIEMSNRLTDWGFDIYLITPQGIKTDWLPVKARVIPYAEARERSFADIIISDPDCIYMFEDIRKKRGIFYHLHAYMHYRPQGDVLENYYILARDYINICNSQWTANQLQTHCHITSQYIIPGGVCKSLFMPYVINKTHDTCFLGIKSRKFKATEELQKALSGLSRLPLADYGFPQNLLAPAISACRVFVSGSYYEGFNFSPLEAMACGVPVVMTDCGGSREYAADGDNALVVPQRDYKALRKQVERVLKDKKLRLRLIENGLETAWNFDWDRLTNKFANIVIPTDTVTTNVKPRPADPSTQTTSHGIDAEDTARKQIHQLRHKLLNLGFNGKAITDMITLAKDDSHPFRQQLAASELVFWHADQHNSKNAQQCLEWLPVACRGNNEPDFLRRAVVIEAECHAVLSQSDQAKSVIQKALSTDPSPDIYLAAANLETSISKRFEYLNAAIEASGGEKLLLYPDKSVPPFDRLGASSQDTTQKHTHHTLPRISVIMPAYNAEKTIDTAVRAVRHQTWHPLEIIVVDDGSTDATVEIIRSAMKQDPRIKLIKNRSNQGPYVARNMGLKKAKGDFVTCHDADDWSHPDKITIQAAQLLNNPDVLATLSNWARCSSNLRFSRRGNRGYYIQPNISSLMFRRKPLMESLGFWDSVRFGADTELYYRIVQFFGAGAVKEIKTILSLARSADNSLTEDLHFGYPGYPMGARKEYQDSYRFFYSKTETLKYKFPARKRPFPVPAVMNPAIPKSALQNRYFDIVVVSDLRILDNPAYSILQKVMDNKKQRISVGLVHMEIYELFTKNRVTADIRRLIDGSRCQMLVYGESVSCRNLIISPHRVLCEKQAFIPKITTETINIIINCSDRDTTDSEITPELLSRCAGNLESYFGKTGHWHPADSNIRSRLAANTTAQPHISGVPFNVDSILFT